MTTDIEVMSAVRQAMVDLRGGVIVVASPNGVGKGTDLRSAFDDAWGESRKGVTTRV